MQLYFHIILCFIGRRCKAMGVPNLPISSSTKKVQEEGRGAAISYLLAYCLLALMVKTLLFFPINLLLAIAKAANFYYQFLKDISIFVIAGLTVRSVLRYCVSHMYVNPFKTQNMNLCVSNVCTIYRSGYREGKCEFRSLQQQICPELFIYT